LRISYAIKVLVALNIEAIYSFYSKFSSMEAVGTREDELSSSRYFIVNDRASMLVLAKGAGGQSSRTRS